MSDINSNPVSSGGIAWVGPITSRCNTGGPSYMYVEHSHTAIRANVPTFSSSTPFENPQQASCQIGHHWRHRIGGLDGPAFDEPISKPAERAGTPEYTLVGAPSNFNQDTIPPWLSCSLELVNPRYGPENSAIRSRIESRFTVPIQQRF